MNVIPASSHVAFNTGVQSGFTAAATYTSYTLLSQRDWWDCCVPSARKPWSLTIVGAAKC